MGREFAICRDCTWHEDGSTSWVDNVEEEAEVHSVMLSHTVDYGTSRRLQRDDGEQVVF